MAVSITICNLALSEMRAPPIAAIDELSKEAQECARAYPICLKLMLERYDWSFATKVAPLAQLMVNDRASEWQYAYTLPADIAKPLRLLPTNGFRLDMVGGVHFQPFVIEDGKLYAQDSAVTLEYSSNDLSEDRMSALFMDALIYSIASRMAVPMRDSRELKGELLKQSEAAIQRAWAADQNRQPKRHDALNDEVGSARGWSGLGAYDRYSTRFWNA